ncbi:MAG: hypothetical protein ACOC12_04120 [Bacteroidota bacterium]
MITKEKIVTAILLLGLAPVLYANSQAEKPNTASIIYSPFQIHIDPMESLLLINFENDPDSLYLGFEPQLFNDSINGEGMLVIAWRTDGFVDVYHQPGLEPDRNKYDIAGKGLAHMIEVPLEGAFFRVEEAGVQAWFRFTDIAGRVIDSRIHESSKRKRKPFGLLAPMGHAAENPSAMPLILLHDFYFVRRANTEVSIRINSRSHEPDLLPMSMDRQKMYFTRYSTDPLIATINPACNTHLEAIAISGQEAVSQNNHYDLVSRNGRQFISRITAKHAHHNLHMNFYPPFPNLSSVVDGDSLNGDFEIQGHPSAGKVKGKYSIVRRDSLIQVTVKPSGGWKPRPDKFSLRFLYTVAGIFKNWPKTYVWKADILMTENGQPEIQAAWTRDLKNQ